MKFIRTVLLLALPLYFISCAPSQKLPNYLENLGDTTGKDAVIFRELRIQKNDMLSIQVFSASTRPEIDDFYNAGSAGSMTGQAATAGGFLVNAKGDIEYPRLGTFHAEGLTKEELAAAIKKRLTEPVELLKDPSVIIRFMNLKVTVMGEVANQGVISIPGERVTILEAVGLAGGITDFGLKDQITVVREIDGKREIGKINLTTDSLFVSPYYTLMQNDVVFVPPTKRKQKKADQDMVIQRVSFGLSIITAVALLYNIF